MDDNHNARHDSMPLFHSLFILASSYVILGAALYFPSGHTEDMLTNVKSKLLLNKVWILLKMSHPL